MNSVAKSFKSTIAIMLSIMLSISLCPLPASAAEEDASEEVDVAWVDDLVFDEYDKSSADAFGDVVIDKEEFYEESDDAAISTRALPTVKPRSLSKEFRYFAKYESSQNYDQGFSSGDGYNALGYYQFDRRYGLKNFMQACYNYNSKKYSMLWTSAIQKINFSTATIYKNGKLTTEGKAIENAWHAAYKADPTEFSNLQNDWAYTNYYTPAYNHLKNNLGIDIKNRRACVKGLVWGMCNLFGQGGWRQFVGGYFNGVNHKGAGLKSSMTDVEFVTKLCNYVVKNVAKFYPSQPQYHQGWQNRYRAEKQDCLNYLYLSDVDPNAWYATCGAIDFVVSKGIMTGYENGLFGPYDNITRGQVATILYRYSNPNSTDTTNSKNYATSSNFKDVAGKQYYTAAINWCQENGVITGYETKPGSGKYTNFRPDNHVTREELAAMMQRYAKFRGADTSGASNAKLKTLVGYKKASSWAQEGLIWCTDNNIITGVAKNGKYYLEPQDNAWRASMAKMIMVASTKW